MRSAWREFAFALHQIEEAIEPRLSMTKVLNHWNEIETCLAASARKRQLQLEKLIGLS